MRCDTIAEGIIAAAREIDIAVPLIVRLEGTNVARGKELLARVRPCHHSRRRSRRCGQEGGCRRESRGLTALHSYTYPVLMKNITLAIDEEVLRAARRYAANHDTTVNALVRDYLTSLVAFEEKAAKARERLVELSRRHRKVVWALGSGIADDAYEGRLLPRHEHSDLRGFGEGGNRRGRGRRPLTSCAKRGSGCQLKCSRSSTQSSFANLIDPLAPAKAMEWIEAIRTDNLASR